MHFIIVIGGAPTAEIALSSTYRVLKRIHKVVIMNVNF